MQLVAMHMRTAAARAPQFWLNATLQAANAVRLLSPSRASRRHCWSATIAMLHRASWVQSLDCAQHFIAWHWLQGSGPGSEQVGASSASTGELDSGVPAS
jgi:hypothetical protein